MLPPPPVPMLGHVTSSYRSAELGRPFGLALVKGGHARIGDTLHVPVDGTLVAVEVTGPSSSIPKEHAAMADTLTATSPLQGWSEKFAQLPPTVNLSEERFVAMVDLRADPDGPAASRASAILGLELPTTPSTCVSDDTLTVIWMGPDEWLVTPEHVRPRRWRHDCVRQ